MASGNVRAWRRWQPWLARQPQLAVMAARGSTPHHGRSWPLSSIWLIILFQLHRLKKKIRAPLCSLRGEESNNTPSVHLFITFSVGKTSIDTINARLKRQREPAIVLRDGVPFAAVGAPAGCIVLPSEVKRHHIRLQDSRRLSEGAGVSGLLSGGWWLGTCACSTKADQAQSVPAVSP